MNELMEEDEPIYCSVCNMSANVHCERCDNDLCAVCATEDEDIIFCYECWLEREAELQQDGDTFEEQQA